MTGHSIENAARVMDSFWDFEANEQKEPPAHDPDVEYLTPSEEFETVERGNPLPYKLPLKDRLPVSFMAQTENT